MHPRWAAEKPHSSTWRAPRGRSRAEAIAEQDRAAGGGNRRVVALPDGGRSTGSIELKLLGGRRVYAYLRYTQNRRTVAVYVGEATGQTRAERLRSAWRIVHNRALTRRD